MYFYTILYAMQSILKFFYENFISSKSGKYPVGISGEYFPTELSENFT